MVSCTSTPSPHMRRDTVPCPNIRICRPNRVLSNMHTTVLTEKQCRSYRSPFLLEQYRLLCVVGSDVSDEYIASFLSFHEYAKEECNMKRIGSHICIMLVSCLSYSSNLKTEELCSSETSLDLQRTTRRYIHQDATPLFLPIRQSYTSTLHSPDIASVVKQTTQINKYALWLTQPLTEMSTRNPPGGYSADGA
jgi:hypothetical protein